MDFVLSEQFWNLMLPLTLYLKHFRHLGYLFNLTVGLPLSQTHIHTLTLSLSQTHALALALTLTLIQTSFSFPMCEVKTI